MARPRHDGPSPRDPQLTGLEVWLSGTPAELAAAVGVLAAAGHIAWHSARRPITGTDAGRHRLYLRLTVAAERPRPATDTSAARGALIDLDTARATRRPA
ncbi:MULTISPECIES: hypothetical protein [unclassified Micromonospora]|uniref:hypothetical protein n=1 Tax=unclassified Micromonospora TaxID=2617518 RepID=UPI00098D35DA|nr:MULTISPECIES: hypothetical protein [unclassified Micromonospora]MDI5942585.1 hypothetical protein [Micromonospora sp. DH15]